jgi:hypothetical protein
MEASRAATGMLEVFATRMVRKGYPGLGVDQTGKFCQDLRDLVSPLAAPYIYYYVSIGPLGERCLRHCLARPETARDDAVSALSDGEKGVDNAGAGDEGNRRVLLLLDRAGNSHRPGLVQLDLFAALQLDHDFVYVELTGPHFGDPARHPGRHHYAVCYVGGLLHLAHDVSGSDLVAPLDHGLEFPQPVPAKSLGGNAAHYKITEFVGDVDQPPLNTVIDGRKQTWAQLDKQWFLGALHPLPDLQARGILVDLDDRGCAIQAHHFTDQAHVAHFGDVVHLGPGHALGVHHRSGYFYDCSLDHIDTLPS